MIDLAIAVMNLTRRYGLELFSNYALIAPCSRLKFKMRAVAGMFDEPHQYQSKVMSGSSHSLIDNACQLYPPMLNYRVGGIFGQVYIYIPHVWLINNADYEENWSCRKSS